MSKLSPWGIAHHIGKGQPNQPHTFHNSGTIIYTNTKNEYTEAKREKNTKKQHSYMSGLGSWSSTSGVRWCLTMKEPLQEMLWNRKS